MVDISVVLGKGKKYTVIGNEIEIKPLTVKHMDLLLDMQDDKKKNDAVKNILHIYIKQVFPSITDEEIGEVSFEFASELMKCVLDVNGIKDAK